MERLYRLFQKASVLGSLINPRADEGDLLVADFYELQPLLERALAHESQDETAHEIAVTARGLAKAAEILAVQFMLVATNVPYLGRGSQDDVLKDYCESIHPEAKTDLATCFVERCLKFCISGGSMGLVSPQNWLFLGKYKKMRPPLLNHQTWNTVFQLGESAFESSQAAGAYVALIGLTRQEPNENHRFLGLDATKSATPSAKAVAIAQQPVLLVSQRSQLKNPDSSISTAGINFSETLGDYIDSYHGITTTDFPRFGCEFWEQFSQSEDWIFHHGSVEKTEHFSGRSGVLFWQSGQGALRELQEAGATVVVTGLDAWGRNGVGINRLRNLNATIYGGTSFDTTIAVLVPRDQKHLAAIWTFCESPEFFETVRSFNKQVVVEYVYFPKVPFDLARWQKVAAYKYPHGLPKPFSSDATQWLFNGHPAGADHPLHVAVARLLGYQWPRQTGSSFPDCPVLTTDGLEKLADDDGIVCLSPARGEAAASDRLRGMLAAAFGEEWSNAKERELLLETAVASDAKKAAADLGDWLRQNFFAEHYKLFQSRPFIWQIWDGNPHGFSALVNYHKLVAPNGQGRKTLELLAYTYLGDWIDRQKLDQAEGVNGADDRLAAALDLQGQLKKILEGESPYDIFVRWKPLYQQAIGWEPDINDGVRLNIRPFLNAQLHKGGKTGAGILRAKPGTIKWAKDRGKEPMRSKDDFPWFWGWDENSPAMATDFGAPVPGAPPAGDSFDGNRWNDLHYTREAKEAARARHRGEG
ncbi:N-6 DNA methylase [Synechococcus sp. BA-124 BA4]|uniref:Eco57I restriction-modification methylase domain-containing protein n=1 Tax=unclassified Synechococcus TaxID=2626047 RepID=UPI002AD3B98D|nr:MULTISPECIES: N-6 DNA methylase [unclassified Synechococcus]MEA5398461.1 N-6 DNA methylase [Synechococcus sp. BA-124 BA4]